MTLLYRLATGAYFGLIRLAAGLGVGRAAAWVAGRRAPGSSQLPRHLRPRPGGERLLWMHCASLGEFEQGRPVLEAFTRAHPDWRIVLTFFSPSGYERRRDEPLADAVLYLPADTPARAARWVAELRPDVAVFVKYEFWYFHLRALHRAGVPTFLIAASFRPGQPFFRPWGGWWRRMLSWYAGVAVQTAADADLLVSAGRYPAGRVHLTGDPRMDRTLELAATPFTDDRLAAFIQAAELTIMAGSVWPPDVALWQAVWPSLPAGTRLVLAPHQLNEGEIAAWARAFGAVRYTTARPADLRVARVLVLDTIGILSRAYRYADVAYVGGGFRTGLHNTLEPLAYGLPVVFGPKHQKFPEAAAAIAAGGAFSVATPDELATVLQRLSRGPYREQASAAQRDLATRSAGAADRTAAVLLQPAGDRGR